MEHGHLEHVAGAVGSEDQDPQRRFVIAHVGDHESIRDGVEHIVGVHPMLAR